MAGARAVSLTRRRWNAIPGSEIRMMIPLYTVEFHEIQSKSLSYLLTHSEAGSPDHTEPFDSFKLLERPVFESWLFPFHTHSTVNDSEIRL